MSQDDPLNSVGILLLEVSRLIRRDFERRARPLGLTQGQWRALLYLSRYEGINQTMLADRLEIRPITLARLIDRLEEDGWVARRRDPKDRRAFRLYLTREVQPVLKELEGLASATRKEATRGLSRQERDQLLELLARMKNNLHPPECRDSQ